jgi:AraC family cel operon transcriptional repressor
MQQQHTHEFYEILVCLSGTVIHCINNQSQTLVSPCLVFIRPEDTHMFKPFKRRTVKAANFAFSTEIYNYIDNYLGNLLSLTLSKHEQPLAVNLKKVTNLYKLFEKMAIYTSSDSENILYSRNVLFDLIDILLNNISTKTSTKGGWVDFLMDAIHQPEIFKKGISELSNIVNKTPEHISRELKKELGITPSAYMQNLRLEYAAKLLLLTDETIIDIGLEAGFNNHSHFYHSFKDKYNMPPGKYRDKFKQTI